MIRPLRKKHLQIWSALLVLIPVGVITAWLSVQQPAHDIVLQPESAQALPHIISSAETKDYIVRLRSNDTLAEQLEWINKDVLTIPSAVIYEAAARQRGIDSADLIGRIEARGNYYFSLRHSIDQRPTFILYDFIHKKIIDSILFPNNFFHRGKKEEAL